MQTYADVIVIVILITVPPIATILPFASRNSARPIRWFCNIAAVTLAALWAPIFAALIL